MNKGQLQYQNGRLQAEVHSLQSELTALREATRWIPVGEKLPEDGQLVLVRWRPYKNLKHRRIVTEMRGGVHPTKDNIIDWMPIPTLPVEDKE